MVKAHGFIKILTVPNKDKMLGVTIVGYHAGELIGEFVFAMTHGMVEKVFQRLPISIRHCWRRTNFCNAWRNERLPEKYFPLLESSFVGNVGVKCCPELKISSGVSL